MKKGIETNKNKNTIYLNLWKAAKTILRGVDILNTYIKKQDRFKNTVIPHFKVQESKNKQSPKLTEGKNNKDYSQINKTEH